MTEQTPCSHEAVLYELESRQLHRRAIHNMIVPTYWAEARVREKVKGRQVTIRRFGWSDVSQADAQGSADIRAREAMLRFMAGDKIQRREPKLSYNGADGVPIREEIISRHGDTVITRNLYGARCLNTPDVLFADIDFEQSYPARLGCSLGLVFMAGSIVLAVQQHSFWLGLLLSFVSWLLGLGVAILIQRAKLKLAGGPEKIARRRLQRFTASHPEWHLRLYRTPAGLRVLAMHRTFKPDEPAVHECFAALGTDPVYAQMCAKQQCFRARVSPKPWRIGIRARIKPRPGVWPVNPERLPERAMWIESYEAAAKQYASCQFIESFGSSASMAATLAVQKLHDEHCRATSALPIA